MTRASTPGWLSTRTESGGRPGGGFFISMASAPTNVALARAGAAPLRQVQGENARAATPGPSHHHLAFLGGRVLEVLRRVAEDHLVVGAARRDHREAVLRRIDHAIEDHRTVRPEYLPDRGVELGRIRAADADAMVRLGELDEIRQRFGVALR